MHTRMVTDYAIVNMNMKEIIHKNVGIYTSSSIKKIMK
jgi:hypothetical protein